VLTVDFARLPVNPGDRVLDLGCGAGRHAFECYRRGARVVALDHSASDVEEVQRMFAAMREAGEPASGGHAVAVLGDAHRLPFPDGAFDTVILSEVLEHIPDDRHAIAEAVRILRPGGMLAVTVPRWWPERICWALSDAYHQVEGGHVRIYRRGELLSRLRAAELVPLDSHHAHALHSPYWWMRCLFGTENERALLPRLYHRLLVYDIMRRPWWTRTAERLLNPFLGKSLVIYLGKRLGEPEAAS
jgi:SAM-dependent methyltransferase